MKYLLAAACLMVPLSAYAQGMQCGDDHDVMKAMIKNHMYPIWAGVDQDKGFILFKGEKQWVFVISKDDKACIAASGTRSKSAEGI